MSLYRDPDSGQPLTHEPRPTIRREEASQWTLDLAMDLFKMNLGSNGELWARLEQARAEVERHFYDKGYEAGINAGHRDSIDI